MSRNFTIVAIPKNYPLTSTNLGVWDISSEKIPHMTLLYFEDKNEVADVSELNAFVQHVVSSFKGSVYVEIKNRGILGDDLADVLFIKKDHVNVKAFEELRAQLLTNQMINNLYLSTEQYPSWTPHVTLGYPSKPARVVKESLSSGSLFFDRIALWDDSLGEFSGAEFDLDESPTESEAVHMSETPVSYLEHYGVKGMKWGVRKDKGHEGERATKRAIAKADKKYEKDAKSGTSWVNIHNTFASKMNAELDAFNARHPDADIFNDPDSKASKAYIKDYERLVDKTVKSMTNDIGTNASGTRQLKVSRAGEGIESTWYVEMTDVKHADGDDDIKIMKVKPKFNSKGRIIGQTLSFVDPEDLEDLEQSDIVEDFLEHFGVKGMKWGVRNNYPGATGRINRMAKKDAKESARAKMYYGEGAGTRRKLIKAKVEARSQNDPSYRGAYGHHLARQDMSKHSDKAKGQRARKDFRNQVGKTTRGVNRLINGPFAAPVSAAVLFGAIGVVKTKGLDKKAMKMGRDFISKYTR